MVGANVIDSVFETSTPANGPVRDRERLTPRIVTAAIRTIPQINRTVERLAKVDFGFIAYLLVFRASIMQPLLSDLTVTVSFCHE